MLSQSLSGIFVNQCAATSLLPAAELERRRVIRVEAPFPATVRGVDEAGERFTLDAVLDNLSACGMYMRLVRPVEPGMKLFVVVRLMTTPAEVAPAPYIAVRGVVLRAEPQLDGRYGLAVEFVRHRFLYAVATCL